MSLTLPPPIPPHPDTPQWCNRCGTLECTTHPLDLTARPVAPRAIPAGREWASARRRNRALAALARIGSGA